MTTLQAAEVAKQLVIYIASFPGLAHSSLAVQNSPGNEATGYLRKALGNKQVSY